MSATNRGGHPAPDVLVIGGGVIGGALAHRLTAGGARVTLVERGQVAGEASRATAGIISPPGSPLEARSFAAYPALIEELREATGLSVEYRRSGKLTVALAAADVAPLRRAMDSYRELGVAVEWLEGDEVRRRKPVLHASVRGALWFSAVGSLRGHRLTTALARAAQLGGATILEGTPVLGLLTAGGRVTEPATEPEGAVDSAVPSERRAVARAVALPARRRRSTKERGASPEPGDARPRIAATRPMLARPAPERGPLGHRRRSSERASSPSRAGPTHAAATLAPSTTSPIARPASP